MFCLKTELSGHLKSWNWNKQRKYFLIPKSHPYIKFETENKVTIWIGNGWIKHVGPTVLSLPNPSGFVPSEFLSESKFSWPDKNQKKFSCLLLFSLHLKYEEPYCTFVEKEGWKYIYFYLIVAVTLAIINKLRRGCMRHLGFRARSSM